MDRVDPNQYGDIRETVFGNEWEIERHGETVLWGEGWLMVDIVRGSQKGYELYVGDNVAFDSIDHDPYILVKADMIDMDGTVDAANANYINGIALGDVKRKMIPAACPDITALPLALPGSVEPATIEA